MNFLFTYLFWEHLFDCRKDNMAFSLEKKVDFEMRPIIKNVNYNVQIYAYLVIIVNNGELH